MLKSLDELKEIAAKYNNCSNTLKKRVIVCAGTGCVANGSLKIYNELVQKINEAGIDCIVELKMEEHNENKILVSESGCQGFCQMGPLVTIEPDGIHYVKVKVEDVQEIVDHTLVLGKPIDKLLFVDPLTGEHCVHTKDIRFYNRQSRKVLGLCGHINPSDVYEYIAKNGYQAAFKALAEMTDKDICEEITYAGLRGRGGGGFPTGRKWELTRIQKSDKKYVICNGDEGDPGAFMDRSVMEGNPHSVIEGMIIAAKAIGADEGYIYVRTEYPFAVKRLKIAVKQAEELGLLGENIMGTGFNFKLHVMEGAGAFVCGEETALMSSIEGKRGMPKPKPPFPAQSGLFGKPTVINNVETLASVSQIILYGAKEFRSCGTENSPGTKTFAMTGHVANTGLIEVPFGTTIREIVYNIGGGVTLSDGTISSNGLKAVQIGGPSGGCLTTEHMDMPLDFDSLSGIGAMVGSGGLVVMNKDTCMVKMAHFFIQFTQNESCGKCIPCREGTKQMLALLEDIIEGRATEETLDILEELAKAVQKGSLCGLGKTAPNPVLSMMTQFREEYEAHVIQKKCPAKQCKALLSPQIIPEKCKGCGLCVKACPVNAISGVRKEVHYINEELCIKCGACLETCRLNAIVGV